MVVAEEEEVSIMFVTRGVPAGMSMHAPPVFEGVKCALACPVLACIQQSMCPAAYVPFSNKFMKLQLCNKYFDQSCDL